MAVMPGGRFRLTAVPTRTLIQLAYGVREFQIVGEPSWVNEERYDVEARAEGITSFNQMRPMLQALLADRFKLAVRRDTRTGRVYELVPARGGLKITPTPPGGCFDPRSPSGPPPVFGRPLTQCDGWGRRILTPPPDRQDRIEAVAVRMATLVDFVIGDVSRPVVDKTGFEQPFNFVLEFTPNVAVSDYAGHRRCPMPDHPPRRYRSRPLCRNSSASSCDQPRLQWKRSSSTASIGRRRISFKTRIPEPKSQRKIPT